MTGSARIRRARGLLVDVIAGAIVAIVMAGHVIGLVLGAADALVTSLLGVPRLSYGARRLVDVVRDTWREEVL
jgi:hypothetical protein